MSNSPPAHVWLGYDSRETTAYAVALHSIRRFDRHIPVKGLVLDHLKAAGLYYRPTEIRTNGAGYRQMWDIISDAPMSTEFSISRFLVPALTGWGWALFADSDVMFRVNANIMFRLAQDDKAIMCVKHKYDIGEGFKMDGQIQTVYHRKNWSSVMLFNCDHPSNKKLTVKMINSLPGRDLHRFCWLEDHEIGELPQEYNYLVGYTRSEEAAVVHFTEGLPNMPGYETQEYADEWRAMLPYAVGAA